MIYYQGKEYRVHRLTYEKFKEPLIEGLTIDHMCTIRACVNPEHLRQVPKGVNTMAPNSQAVSAIYARRTHCSKGHAYPDQVTYKHHNGGRRCLECQRVWSKEWRTRKRLATT